MKAYAIVADGQTVAEAAGAASAQPWRVASATWPAVAAFGVALGVAFALALAGALVAALAALVLTAVAAFAALPRRLALHLAPVALGVGALLLAFAPTLTLPAVAAVTTGIAFFLVCIGAALLGRATRTALDSLVALRDSALIDRRNAKDRSREATARLLDLAASIDEVLWETDPAGRLRFVSGSFERSTGFAPDHVLGKTPAEAAEKMLGRAGRFAACTTRMRARAPIRGLRLLWQDRTGARHLWVVHGAPHFDDDGNFVRYRGVVLERRAVSMARPRTMPPRPGQSPP